MKKIEVKGPIVSNDTADLYDWFGWDCACPRKLADALSEANGEDVEIEVNSTGGVCIYGYEMYTAIKAYSGKVTANVICAMSAATLITCAADSVLMSDSAIFMIHNAQSSARGDYRDLGMEADALKEFNAGIINVYVKKTGKSREEIQGLMDNDTYMSPQRAIELGFADGYMFGEEGKESGNIAAQVVASEIPVVPEDKAKEILRILAGTKANGMEKNPEAAGKIPDGEGMKKEKAESQQDGTEEGQTNGEGSVSDKSKTGGEKMTLEELLNQNPEAKAEIEKIKAAAREEGVKAERDRMQSLDAIAKTVSAEALNDAKYGENQVDGKELAYKAAIEEGKRAAGYMKEAKEDSKESGAEDVGIGNPETNEADDMAAYVNKKKGER